MSAPLNLPTFEYILVVATPTEETELQAAAGELGVPFVKRVGPDGPYFDLGQMGRDAGNRVVAVRIQIGPFGYGGSAGSAIRYMRAFGAQNLICLGMAFGVDSFRQAPGDVLVSSVLLPYDSRHVVCDDDVPSPWRRWSFRRRPHHRYDYSRMKMFPAQTSLLRLFQHRGELPPHGVHAVHFGALLTGGSRISCSRYRDRLVEDVACAIGVDLALTGRPVPPIIGGEMEGVGLLSSCDPSAPSWIVVKGISDFADGNQAGFPERRKLACRNAAMFVLQALLAKGPPSHG